jgi:hypothetical protein
VAPDDVSAVLVELAAGKISGNLAGGGPGRGGGGGAGCTYSTAFAFDVVVGVSPLRVDPTPWIARSCCTNCC